MKYIKRINESMDFKIFQDIKECFVEFYDEDKYGCHFYQPSEWKGIAFNFSINFSDIPKDDEVYKDIDKVISMREELIEFYENVKVCCEKFKSMNPNYRCSFRESISYKKDLLLTIAFNCE